MEDQTTRKCESKSPEDVQIKDSYKTIHAQLLLSGRKEPKLLRKTVQTTAYAVAHDVGWKWPIRMGLSDGESGYLDRVHEMLIGSHMNTTQRSTQPKMLRRSFGHYENG
jgi:hypothetical protein